MKTLTYEPSCGQHISDAVGEALELSLCKASPVKLTFNDTTLDILYSTSLDKNYWLDVWAKQREEEHHAYEQSPAYKEKQERLMQERKENQDKMDKLISSFKIKFSSPLGLHLLDHDKALAEWFVEFIPLADKVGVEYDKEPVVNYLRLCGYTKGDMVGYKGFWGAKMTQRWIYGQILDGIEQVGCPHPICRDKLQDILDEGEI